MKKLYLLILLPAFAVVYGQTPEEKEWIRKHYDIRLLERIADSIKTVKAANKEYALRQAEIYNWPLSFTDGDGNLSELIGVERDTVPLYYITHNVAAAVSTRTNYLHTGGALGLELDGGNMYMAVWDGGHIKETHQEFAGRVFQGDGPWLVSPHATHVTGTIFASGVVPQAKGMAPLATGTAYDWDNDQFEMIVEATNGLLVSNHSYGLNPIYVGSFSIGDYSQLAHDWDQICYNSPYYLPVTSAGNNGLMTNSAPMPGAGTTYDKLFGQQTAKNPLVVANALDATIDAEGNLVSVSIYPTSSTGPTDDLRIKPDITGNGHNVYSSTSTSDTSYGNMTGTSMASPNVAGSLLLLQEHSRNINGFEFMMASTLKGLVLHTADDILTAGPDAISGWGLLNAKRAAETMTDNGVYSLITENNLAETDTYTVQVLSDGIHPLSASISWTDKYAEDSIYPPANNADPVLINNLNLKVVQGPDGFYPYYLTSPTSFTTGVNNMDPYERVDIPSAAGYYTIEVSHDGPLQDWGNQDYALIITGIIVCTASDTDIAVTDPVGANENDTEHALENITANNKIYALGEAYYRAGMSITMTDGFYAAEDSDVLIEIGDCGIIEQQSFGSSARKRPQTSKPVADINGEVKKLLIYPNPASSSVTVKLDSGLKRITITGMDGKAVIDRQANGKEYTVDVAHLEKGIYIISVENNNGELMNDKLVIN